MNAEKFLNEVRRLFRTAFVQKFVLMVLRAAWLGGAVYIFCWGSHELWGWFPHQERWIFYAASVSILILLSMLRYLKASRAFIWRVDRTFGFGEQLFTVFERISQLGENADQDPGTRMLLESDAVSDFPKLRRQISGSRGKFRREIESTLVVLILLMIIYLAGISSIDRLALFPTGLSFLPPVPSEPQSRDIFQSGIPGDESEPAEPDEYDSGDQEEDSVGRTFDPLCDPNLLLAPDVWQQTQDLLSQLGENLCCGSATFTLSEGLRLPDYAGAGDEFSVMAGRIMDYSADTRLLLSTQFLNTSVQFQQAGQPGYSALFAGAASALLDGTPGEMAEGLDGLSVLMDQFAMQHSCITIVEWQPGGQLLPSATDIDPADLPVISSSVDFLPVEEPTATDSSATVTGVDGGVQYYEVPMEDTDVVSSYFSPQ
ncbi:MAG: hypothetical protein ACK2T7_07935 [Anaerolineales bacterium]